MQLNDYGWLEGRQTTIKPSPHFNARPSDTVINACVIHNITLPPKQFGSTIIDAFFMGEIEPFVSHHPFLTEIKSLKVSSHFLILRNGFITQYVATSNRAWHAGISSLNGISNCNDYSIGIELNGCDDTPYTYKQYQSLSKLINTLMKTYPSITKNNIVSHAEIAPGRKTDPGPAFNFTFLHQLLKYESRSPRKF